MRYLTVLFLSALAAMQIGCSPSKGNRTGHEYMPDMVHNIGYEANLYDFYSYNRWGTEADYKQYVNPRHSVPGTVARGAVSVAGAADLKGRYEAMAAFQGKGEGSIAIDANGHVPYYYSDTEDERLRATNEIRLNPFPITQAGLEHGKQLYEIYCGICHGNKGDGQGYLVREEDPAKGIVAGVYPAAPANFMLDTFVNSSVGRIYHSIMYGKNVMGSYADKLSFQERWEVIHYIRFLQAESKKLKYSPTENTFNSEAIPWSVAEAGMKQAATPGPAKQDAPAQGHGNTNHH